MYISVRLANIEGSHAFPVTNAHVSVAYRAPFSSWREVHEFKIKARAHLQSHTTIGIWMEFRVARSCNSFFLVDSCEGHTFVQMVQDMLPQGQPDAFDLHMTFGRV